MAEMEVENSGAGQHIEGPIASATKGKRHFRLRTIFSVVVMCLGSISYAYSAGIIGNTIAQPSFYRYMKLSDTNAAALTGATTSLYYAGGVFGALSSHSIGDRFGRKTSIYMGGAIIVRYFLCTDFEFPCDPVSSWLQADSNSQVVSAALCAGSVHIAMFIVFRFVSGFGALILSMTIPVWITECVPPEVRGAFAQFHAVGVSTGYLLASYVGVGFYVNVSPASLATWRGPQAIGAVPAICLLCGLWWVPESPRYLLMKGREEEARDIIRKLHSSSGDTLFAEMEAFQMKKQIELDRTLPSSWSEIFRRPSLRKRMLMTIFVVFSVLSSGNLTIVLYATQMYESLGFDALKQQLLQAGQLAAVMPGLVAAIFFTERLRRPTMVAIGLSSMVIVLSCYTAVSAQFAGQSNNRSAQIAGVALVYIYLVLSAALTEGPCAYWSAEFFPTHLRAKGATINVVTFCVVSILWTQSASSAISNIQWRFFLVFICITAVTSPIIYFFFPDTQGKSLEEVALLFGDTDLVVVCQEDIVLDAESHTITGKIHIGGEEKAVAEHLDTVV
ncbi:uncharacterized protein PV07_05534 [Cladophialophora immunda]|uniref:Major facilitator superfamily (MFS) profile domain-containing protein n=1 Tax=Cladophialophora immunda TaxID=569365 RepID=A0A0D2CHU4_9EURO|nr:uncharacterized protein PV07_05534 [Cladophialophora immunda]KIW29745.1 hypothetical protein PV07_05534 [Cladophialophora immunda]